MAMKQKPLPDRFLAELNKAIALHQQDRLAEAEPIYRQLLGIAPDHFDVVHLLGTLLRRTGKPAESLSLLDRAVAMRPESAAAQLNRANVLVDRRAFAEARAGFSRALALKPGYAEAHYGRGVAELELGNPQAARQDAEAALRLKPGYAEAVVLLGMSLSAEDRLPEARQVFLSLLAKRPAWPQVLLELGRVLRREKTPRKAVEALGRALQLDPNSAAAAFELALALRDIGQIDHARTAVERAIARDPGLAQAHGLRGDLLREQGLLAMALASYDDAVRLAPEAPHVHSARGHLLSDLGRDDEAAASYEAALARRPHHASALYGLGLRRRMSPGDPLLAQLREAYAHARLSEAERCELCFAMAKACEEMGDPAASFAALQEANALRKKDLGYTIAQDEALFASLLAAAPRLMAAGADVTPLAGPVPLFIVGMPRSGTTLLEQIVSAGPDVQGLGELNFVRQYGLELATGQRPASPQALQEFASRYLAAVAPLAAGRPWVVDKMPSNFQFVPLICAALPQARILHIHRDARAVCWSNFKHYFASRSLGFAYDLSDLARYYALYAEMMRQWHVLCAGRVLDVDYESLTAQPDDETRRIIASLGLAWHDDYLAPEKNGRLVRTASAQQVRKPIYRGSSEAWKAFAPFVGAALDKLPPSQQR